MTDFIIRKKRENYLFYVFSGNPIYSSLLVPVFDRLSISPKGTFALQIYFDRETKNGIKK